MENSGGRLDHVGCYLMTSMNGGRGLRVCILVLVRWIAMLLVGFCRNVAIVALVIGKMESGRHSYRLKVCGELVREGLCACKLAWTHTPKLRHGESWGHWAHQSPSQIELEN